MTVHVKKTASGNKQTRNCEGTWKTQTLQTLGFF